MSGQLFTVETLESRILFDTWYVDDVATNGNGSISSPFSTLQAALNHANTGPGDTIYVRAGTYRAYSQVQQGKHGDATGLLTIAAYPGDAAPVFKGSDLVTGWVQHSGSIWKKTGWMVNSQQVFDDGAPLQQIGRPPNPPYNPSDGWDEYPNPVGTGLASMAPGRFFYDDAADTLYVQLADSSNPNSSLMEASVRDRIFFSDPSRDYIKIDGLIFEHGNASAVREQDALVTLGSNSIFEDSIARYGDFAGLSLGLYTTNVQIIGSQFLNNGVVGIQGPGSYNFTIRDSDITGNNYRNFNRQWHAAGIKVTTDAYGLIEGNTVGNNNGSGIWFDYADGVHTSTIRGNYIFSNGPEEAAIFWEASRHGKIYNNVLVNNNRRGIYVSGSDDTQIYSNTIVGQQGLSAIEVATRGGVNSTNTTIRNNIISGGSSSRDVFIGLGSGNTSNYNNVFRSGGAVFSYNGSAKTFAQWQALGYDANSTTVSPAFATSSGDSYTLSSTSPGRDTGVTLGDVTTDYVGTTRPQGSAYDMGAYEYVPAGGLVGHWRLDESSGTTTADASGGGNTGSLQNGAAWTTPGKDGASHLTFDGTNDRVTIADSATLDVSTAMSIGGWFNHAASGGSGTTGVQKLNAYRLTTQEVNAASSKWQFFIVDPGGGTHQVTTASAHSNDAWHYVMGVFTGTQLLIYVDGVQAATPVNWTGTIQNSAHPLVLGQRDSVYYKGQMDEIRVYNRALTGTEVAALDDTLDSGLVAGWQLDENTGSTTGDSSGNGNSGTINGATWTAGHSGASALSFDGFNDRVTVANSTSLAITGPISIGGWFYHSSTGGTGTSGIDKDTYRLTVTQTTGSVSTWQFYVKDSGGGVHTITTGNVSNDAWHHVMGVYDGSHMRIYVDGVEAATAVAYSGGVGSSTQDLKIGHRIGTSYYYSGKMDDLRIYSRALSAAEVQLLTSL